MYESVSIIESQLDLWVGVLHRLCRKYSEKRLTRKEFLLKQDKLSFFIQGLIDKLSSCSEEQSCIQLDPENDYSSQIKLWEDIKEWLSKEQAKEDIPENEYVFRLCEIDFQLDILKSSVDGKHI